MASISQDEFKVLLPEVDVGLLSLARSHTAHNFSGNDLTSVINGHQAGFVFGNGDDAALLKAAKDLVMSFELRQQCACFVRIAFFGSIGGD